MHLRIFHIIILLISGVYVYPQEQVLKRPFERQAESKISELESFFKRSYDELEFNELKFKYIPVFITENQNKINSLSFLKILDSLSLQLLEIIILDKHYKPIGSWKSCKYGSGYVTMTRKRYEKLSLMPCWEENRLVNNSILAYNGVTKVIKREKEQLMFFVIDHREHIYFSIKGFNEILKL